MNIYEKVLSLLIKELQIKSHQGYTIYRLGWLKIRIDIDMKKT